PGRPPSARDPQHVIQTGLARPCKREPRLEERLHSLGARQMMNGFARPSLANGLDDLVIDHQEFSNRQASGKPASFTVVTANGLMVVALREDDSAFSESGDKGIRRLVRQLTGRTEAPN